MNRRIVVTHTDDEDARRWRDALAERLPAYEVAIDDGSTGAPADYAVGWAPAADFFARQPALRAFFSAAAGVDHLLRHPALQGGGAPPIYRLEDAGMADQMAEYCCHEVIRCFRGWAAYDAQQARGEWREHETPAREAFTVGLFGLGRLGTEVARALRVFAYPVAAYTRSERRADGIDCYHGGSLTEFLSRCRVLILLAPLTAETVDRVDAGFLAGLPVGAWLINVARGGLVVERDLLAALDSGRLGGATLDVFRDEPLPPGHPFWSHPRVRITPHIAAVTLIGPGADQVADKIGRLDRGEPASGLVERQRGY